MQGDFDIEVISGSEVEVYNDSGVPERDVAVALRQAGFDKVGDALTKWVEHTRPTRRRGRRGGIFDRDRWLSPEFTGDKIHLARHALKDDIIGGAADGTEALAIDWVDVVTDDEDEENIWGQILADLNITEQVKKGWRAAYSDSQFATAVWWDTRSYTVQGKTDSGRAKRKKFTDMVVPIAMTFMDASKIIPVGSLMFGMEQLCYMANPIEAMRIDAILANRDRQKPPTASRESIAALGKKRAAKYGTPPKEMGDFNTNDPIVEQLFVSRYNAEFFERMELIDDGVDVTNLFLLNPAMVYRHTLTKLDHNRFADVRLESCFELLDMKSLLRQMDRAFLIGGPLRVDQRVVTPAGWKPIGNVAVGDEVFSVDGKPTRVVGVYPQGELPMYRVTFTDGAEVICDGSHPWTVRRPDARRAWRTIPLDQIIREGLFVGVPTQGKRLHRHRVPVAAAVELPEAELPLDPYLVGYMLGDGSFGQCVPKIASSEGDFPWSDVLPVGVTVSVYSEPSADRAGCYGLKGSRWHHNEVAEGLRAVGLWEVLDEDKFIPDVYLWASVEQRWALLQGICDSDGHSSMPGGVEVSSISLKLAEGLVQLAQSLGCAGKITPRRVRSNERPCYRVWLSINQQDAPFRLQRKIASWRPRRHPYVRAIDSVERISDAEAVCIKVDRDDGLFLTEGFVVTHNTNWILLITKGDKDRPALPEELHQLQAQAYNIASVPVIVADHRLEVKIVTPPQDHTLDRSKWDALDMRLFARAWGTFILAGETVHDPVKLGMIIGRGLGSRRSAILTHFENSIIDRTRRMNKDDFKHRATLRCHPGTINIAFDAAWASFLLDLRAQNDTSRDTILAQFGMRQADEARMRERERKSYDPIFMTQDPHGTPNPMNDPNKQDPNADPPADPGGDRAAQRQAGRRGGGRTGGAGAAPGSGQGKPARAPRHKANENQKRIAAMSRTDLLKEATRLQIKGRHGKPRDELIALVQEAEEALGDD